MEFTIENTKTQKQEPCTETHEV